MSGMVSWNFPDWSWDHSSVVFNYFIQLSLLLAIFVSVVQWRIPVSAVVGGRPGSDDYRFGFRITVFVFLFAVASGYALFYSLSFVSPDFVQWWWIDSAGLVFVDEIDASLPSIT